MSYLVDTHVLLWFAAGDVRLSAAAAAIVQSEATAKWFSVASIWEIAIKSSLGRLSIDRPFADFIRDSLALTGCRLLPIEVHHLAELVSLPNHHRDPFDRLLVAQARAEGLVLLTADDEIKAYDIEVAS